MQRLLGYSESKVDKIKANKVQDQTQQAVVTVPQVPQVLQMQVQPVQQAQCQPVPIPVSVPQMQVSVQKLQVQQAHTQQIPNQNFLLQMVPQFYSSEEVVENPLLKFGNTMQVN